MAQSPYISAPNILDSADYSTKALELVFAGNTTIKAGTPINGAGEIANDGTAIGVLLEDVHDFSNHVGKVVICGRVNTEIAAEHSGVDITDDAKAAMNNLTFTYVAPPVPPTPSVIEWDGNTEGREVATVQVSGMEVNYYKVGDYSEALPDVVVGGSVFTSMPEGGMDLDPITEENLQTYEGFSIIGSDIFFVIIAEGATDISTGDLVVHIPAAGVYFGEFSLMAEGLYIQKFVPAEA